MVSLMEHLRRLVDLSEDEEQLLNPASFREISVSRRSILMEPERSSWIYVVEGSLRVAHREPLGKDRTLQFGLEGMWVFLPGEEARKLDSGFLIQAVEACRFIVVSSDERERLIDRFPILERYFRKVFERMSEAALWRLHLMSRHDGERMYHEFQLRHTDFLQRVPQTMLASFLGFTPEYLSKIRARHSHHRS